MKSNSAHERPFHELRSACQTNLLYATVLEVLCGGDFNEKGNECLDIFWEKTFFARIVKLIGASSERTLTRLFISSAISYMNGYMLKGPTVPLNVIYFTTRLWAIHIEQTGQDIKPIFHSLWRRFHDDLEISWLRKILYAIVLVPNSLNCIRDRIKTRLIASDLKSWYVFDEKIKWRGWIYFWCELIQFITKV